MSIGDVDLSINNSGEYLQTPEVTAQDKGAPSPVPYSVMIQKPSPDIDPQGQVVIRINLALKSLDNATLERLIPGDCRIFVEWARKSFLAGYYRFELIVGDWSIKVYKHPNNK